MNTERMNEMVEAKEVTVTLGHRTGEFQHHRFRLKNGLALEGQAPIDAPWEEAYAVEVKAECVSPFIMSATQLFLLVDAGLADDLLKMADVCEGEGQ